MLTVVYACQYAGKIEIVRQRSEMEESATDGRWHTRLEWEDGAEADGQQPFTLTSSGGRE